jgi:membrane protease YdiL (CAAX protease family)
MSLNPVAPGGRAHARLGDSRQLSALELLLGAAIVIGHNVFHVVPNEVPILFILALVSMRLRAGSWAWSTLGFRRPQSWRRVVVIALGVAALRIFLGDLVIEPLTARFWPPAALPAAAQPIGGDLKMALVYLGFVWGFAAFGEEIGYRGYLLERAADCGGRSKAAFWAAVIVTSILFGYGHHYKGPAGMIDSGIAGLLLGSAYVLSGRNLWVTIFAHGFIDTFAIAVGYLGFDS